jgi:serine/threonine protein kinase
MSYEIAHRCELHAGEYIDRSFRVDKILGEGSFGQVFLVTGANGQNYALKLLKLWEVPAEIRQPLMLRFDMEFQTGQIESEYLVRSLSYGQFQGNPYIVMEYCPGGDLGQYIGTSLPAVSQVSRQILSGLKDLHRCGKVHRDLKPENILFKKNGKAALTDFGISGDRNKRMTERNFFGKPQQIFGTYAYMPPEQVNRLRGEATVLPTTDLFSFGVVLYHLLTGRLPFGELNNHNDLVVYQKNAKEGNWDRKLIRKASDGKSWESVVESCLVPDFKQRIQTAKEVVGLLPCPYDDDYSRNSGDFRSQSPNKQLLLRVMQGEEFGRTYSLSDLAKEGMKMFTIGRENTNNLLLKETQSAYISRFHCTIETESHTNRWFIRDGQWKAGEQRWQESTNGTYVNSAQVTSEGLEFHGGDIISIGDIKLRVEEYT